MNKLPDTTDKQKTVREIYSCFIARKDWAKEYGCITTLEPTGGGGISSRGRGGRRAGEVQLRKLSGSNGALW